MLPSYRPNLDFVNGRRPPRRVFSLSPPAYAGAGSEPLSNVTLSLSTRLKINSAKGLKSLTAFSFFGTRTRFLPKTLRFFAHGSE